MLRSRMVLKFRYDVVPNIIQITMGLGRIMNSILHSLLRGNAPSYRPVSTSLPSRRSVGLLQVHSSGGWWLVFSRWSCTSTMAYRPRPFFVKKDGSAHGHIMQYLAVILQVEMGLMFGISTSSFQTQYIPLCCKIQQQVCSVHVDRRIVDYAIAFRIDTSCRLPANR